MIFLLPMRLLKNNNRSNKKRPFYGSGVLRKLSMRSKGALTLFLSYWTVSVLFWQMKFQLQNSIQTVAVAQLHYHISQSLSGSGCQYRERKVRLTAELYKVRENCNRLVKLLDKATTETVFVLNCIIYCNNEKLCDSPRNWVNWYNYT